MDAVEVLGWTAVALTVVRLASQPWHNLRTRRIEGVSAAALGNNLVSDLGWVVYGLAVGLAPVWVVAAIIIPVDALALVVARSRADRWTAVSAAVWAGALGGAWLAAGTPGLGAVLVVSVAVGLAPQVVAVLRLPRLPGLSMVTVGLGVADAVVWGAYGLATADATLVLYGVVLLAGKTVIGWRVVATGRTSPGPAAPPARRAYTARS